MEEISFTEIAKNYLLNTIEDIDEIVLKFGNMAPPDILGYKIEREYFHFETDGSSGELYKISLTKEDYYNKKFYPQYTTLNYKEFIEDFDLGQFGIFLRDIYLIGEYNEYFRPQSINYVNDASNEVLMKVRLKKVFQNIELAYWELGEITNGWYYNEPLNDIQSTVITLFRESYLVVKQSLIDYYANILSDIVSEFNNSTIAPNKSKLDYKKDSIWFRLSEVIAKGRIKFEKRKFYLDGEKIESTVRLSELLADCLEHKATSIRPFLSHTYENVPTMGQPNYDKNIFSKSHLKGLEYIESTFPNGNIDIYFKERLDDLKNQIV